MLVLICLRCGGVAVCGLWYNFNQGAINNAKFLLISTCHSNLKIKSAIKSGLKIIFCIGETLKERRQKKTNQILKKQIKKGLKSIKNKSKIIIAYEPVWSIGTGVIPKEAVLNDAISFIKLGLFLRAVFMMTLSAPNSIILVA